MWWGASLEGVSVIYIFFFGFILLFYGGYILLGLFVGWGIVTATTFTLNLMLDHLGSLLKRKQKLTLRPISTETVRLDDPIGVMSVISHRYSQIYFLKDLAFLEVELFGASSPEVTTWFRSAEADSRPEVCGASAGKILLFLSRVRQSSISSKNWNNEQENIWKRGVPQELQSLLARPS